MKKSQKIGSYLLLLITLLISSILHADNVYLTSASPVVFSSYYSGKEWVEKCIEEHPEILWLADAHVRKTEEGQASSQSSYSEQLFGQKYIEFDRTIMTLYCLKLILDGSDRAYLSFTAAQPKEVKLSRESFQNLYLQGQQLLHSNYQGLPVGEIAQAMETALVLGDIGKSELARKLFKPYNITVPDHDDFYGEAIKTIEKHPDLCPSFARLPDASKKLLIKVANLAHYGHITHLEGTSAMFSKLKESTLAATDPIALSFDLFVHTCDVAGALGHVNNQSSLMYTEPTHRAVQAMNDAVRVLADPNKSELDAYNAYLFIRASWLDLCGEDKIDSILARIGAMLRLLTPEEGIIIKQAILSLDPEMQERIITQLNVLTPNAPKRTPTYMPAVLVNLSNNQQLGATKEERLSQAITLGLPFITRVLEKYKELVSLGKIDPNIPLNFNKAAGVAKTAPYLLNNEFTIDSEGMISLKTD